MANSAISLIVRLSKCAFRTVSCAAVDKIFTGIGRRAVPLQ